MITFIWFLVFFLTFGVLAYHAASIAVSTVAIFLLMALYTKFGCSGWLLLSIYWGLFIGVATLLNVVSLRRKLLTQKLYRLIRAFMPQLSETEKAALDAGTVGWEGELFSGRPNWNRFNQLRGPSVSEEEQAFLDGPLNELCSMVDDWEITHELFDLPETIWSFLRKEGFFGLIIPKAYGGKEFSAIAHSHIVTRLSGLSSTLGTIVCVPNSLGPAELLLEYGTEAQKKHYLPRLASGEEIPCFALTGPESGSDASNMPDTGVICKGKFEGKEVIGIRLNWDKRYITLAPIATVLGLAFRLQDPDHLMGDVEDIGITCALIPTNTEGVVIGRRHLPLNSAFPNGPTQGKDVFIPMDWLIGGFERAGQGWKMLVERLGVGRAISLPSMSTGGALTAAAASGAYARIREQFGLPIGKFGGIQEALARIGGHAYIMNAMRQFTVSSIDAGEEPAVPSAMSKYHVTEMGRKVASDAMDVHGGKGICLGPKNYLGRGYQATPIGITVEGANILTRSMIIFGQGAVRCHPYLLSEIQSVSASDPEQGLAQFDQAIIGHIGHVCTNLIRALWLNLTRGKFSQSASKKYKHYYQGINCISASFAFMVDVTMALLGNRMKRLEKISGRLGDVHSMMFMTTAVLKHFNQTKQRNSDRHFVDWSCQLLLCQAETALDSLLRNYPNRWVATACRWIVFPLGRRYQMPSDQLGEHIARSLITPSKARDRLFKDIYAGGILGKMHQVFEGMVKTQEIRGKLHHAARKGKIDGVTLTEHIASAKEQGLITDKQYKALSELDALRLEIIHVDDFDADEHTS